MFMFNSRKQLWWLLQEHVVALSPSGRVFQREPDGEGRFVVKKLELCKNKSQS